MDSSFFRSVDNTERRSSLSFLGAFEEPSPVEKFDRGMDMNISMSPSLFGPTSLLDDLNTPSVVTNLQCKEPQ